MRAHVSIPVPLCVMNVITVVFNRIPPKAENIKYTWVVNEKGAGSVEEPALWGQAGGRAGHPGEGTAWTGSEKRQYVSSPDVLTSGEASA